MVLSYLVEVEESKENTGGQSREPLAIASAASGSGRDPLDPGAKSYVVVRDKPTMVFAVSDLKELIPMGWIQIDVPAAYRRQDCKLESSTFDSLYIEDSEILNIHIDSFAELTRGVKGKAPLGSLIWTMKATYKSPHGLVMRYCMICGGDHPASLTWCCGRVKGQPTMAQFRAAFKDGSLCLRMLYTKELVPYIPFLNVTLFSLCLLSYARTAEAMKMSEKLILSIVHQYTVMTGKTVEYAHRSLKDIQELSLFGTPSRDEFEHKRNQDENVWRPLFRGFDADGPLPNPEFSDIREALDSNKSTGETALYKESLKSQQDMAGFYQAAGVMHQQEALHRLWDMYTRVLDVEPGTRADMPWLAAPSVKNEFVTSADALKFFVDPSTQDKKARGDCSLYRKELVNFIKSANVLIEKSLVIAELWEQSKQGSELNLLSDDDEHQLITRLKDEVDMLRKLAFPVFPKYTLYPHFMVTDFEGNPTYPFLRHDMFRNEQQPEGYTKAELYATHEYITDLKDFRERWWMFVDIKQHYTMWSYITAFITFCDDFVASSESDDAPNYVPRTDIQVRLLGATTWFATIEWYRRVRQYPIRELTRSTAEYYILRDFPSSTDEKYGERNDFEPTGEHEGLITAQRALAARIAAFDGLDESIIYENEETLFQWLDHATKDTSIDDNIPSHVRAAAIHYNEVKGKGADRVATARKNRDLYQTAIQFDKSHTVSKLPVNSDARKARKNMRTAKIYADRILRLGVAASLPSVVNTLPSGGLPTITPLFGTGSSRTTRPSSY